MKRVVVTIITQLALVLPIPKRFSRAHTPPRVLGADVGGGAQARAFGGRVRGTAPCAKVVFVRVVGAQAGGAEAIVIEVGFWGGVCGRGGGEGEAR